MPTSSDHTQPEEADAARGKASEEALKVGGEHLEGGRSNLTLPTETRDQLRKLADAAGVPMSAVVEWLVVQADPATIKHRMEAEPVKRRKPGRRKKSFF